MLSSGIGDSALSKGQKEALGSQRRAYQEMEDPSYQQWFLVLLHRRKLKLFDGDSAIGCPAGEHDGVTSFPEFKGHRLGIVPSPGREGISMIVRQLIRGYSFVFWLPWPPLQ